MVLVILNYDHILTFADEVRLIWRAPWSKLSVVFLLNRYVTFFTVSYSKKTIKVRHTHFADDLLVGLRVYSISYS